MNQKALRNSWDGISRQGTRLVLAVMAIWMAAGTGLAWGQPAQHTTVTKNVGDNPSLGIVRFEGGAEARSQLLNILQRCDWFKVLPDAQAGTASVKLQVRHTAAGYEALVSRAGGADFSVQGQGTALNLASYQLVDAILNKLFNVPAYCTRPIVFVVTAKNNTKELFRCYLDGQGQERLTFNQAISTEPAWGHSRALVYTLIKNNSLQIVLMDAGNKRQRVVSRASGLNSSPSLSPDGKWLALPLSQDRRVDLYAKNLADGSTRRLTQDVYVESSPCWSPDGKTICFVSDKVSKPQLYLVPATGGQPQRLQLGGNECVSPDWSAVSNKLCYATKSNSGQYVIAVLDMANRNGMPTVITAAAGDWEAPAWAPDGRHIVCTRTSGGKRDLYLVDSWLRTIMPISQGGNVSLPAWAPAF